MRGKSQTIGVIAPQMGHDYQSTILQGIYRASATLGYRILIGFFDHDPTLGAQQVSFLLEQQVEGFIFFGDEGAANGMSKWLDIIAAENLPCVMVDERSHAGRVDCVVSDDFEGAKEATRHLIRLGHTRIGHVSAGARMSTSRDREAGFRAAMAEAGLKVNEHSVAAGSYFLEEGSRAAEKLIKETSFTAIVTANDLLALLVREEAILHDKRVPADLAIIGYGNTELAVPLQLTSVDQRPLILGETAARRLMKRLADRTAPPEEIKIPTRLIVRRTCGCKQAYSQ